MMPVELSDVSIEDELFTAALGLHNPWAVQSVDFRPDAGRIDFHVGFARGSHFDCPGCGASEQPVHDTRARQWRHLNFFQYQAFVNCEIPRTRCTACGKTLQVPVPWAREGSGFTLMFEAFAITLARQMPILAIARIFGVGDDPLWRMLRHHVDKARAAEYLDAVRRVGIDETASRRGQNYMTVVHDLDAGRVIFACEGRDQSTVERFAADLHAHGGSTKDITDACTDLSKAFIAGVTKHLPGATLSFDPFHVVALANTALDEVRREEVKREPELRGSRWALLKDSAKLTKAQLTTFHHLMRSGTGTARAWRLKQSLRDVFALAQNAVQAEALLERWYSWARRARLAPFKRLATTIRNHLPGILAHFDSRLSNGPVESVNGLIQAAKARARGYRNIENLITMTFLIGGRLTALPQNPMITRTATPI